MESKEEALEKAGLSKNEAKAYLALLEIGTTTAGRVAKKAQLHRANAYDSLRKLTEKGIASYSVKEGEHFYEAADPNFLVNLIEEKKSALNRIMPELMLAKRLAKHKGSAQIYEGVKSLTSILASFLSYKEPIYVFGAPKDAPSSMSAFLSQFHKERIKKKIVMKHICNTDYPAERIALLKKMPYTEVKLLAEKYDAPVSTLICKDEVILTLWTTNPLVNIHIKSAEIAEAYKRYFALLYASAK